MSFTLMLGGARSGKSDLAQRLVSDYCSNQSGAEVAATVVVTAEVGDGDAEMVERIAKHQNDRPEGWQTVEAPLELCATINSLEESAVVLLDCLTLWVTNLFLRGDSPTQIEAEAKELAEALARRVGKVVVVSNELGMGIVPEHKLTRTFRDVHGRVNRIMSELADEAYLVVAGRPLRLESADKVFGFKQ